MEKAKKPKPCEEVEEDFFGDLRTAEEDEQRCKRDTKFKVSFDPIFEESREPIFINATYNDYDDDIFDF